MAIAKYQVNDRERQLGDPSDLITTTRTWNSTSSICAITRRGDKDSSSNRHQSGIYNRQNRKAYTGHESGTTLGDISFVKGTKIQNKRVLVRPESLSRRKPSFSGRSRARNCLGGFTLCFPGYYGSVGAESPVIRSFTLFDNSASSMTKNRPPRPFWLLLQFPEIAPC